MSKPVSKQSELNEIQRKVTQEGATEAPFSGKLLQNKKTGIYQCICCGQALFQSESKYDSGCGWPSFYQAISNGVIRYLDDYSHNMHRVEIRCGQCDAHLGHIFPDGPQPTGERYCVNSAALCFYDAETGEKQNG